MRKKERLKGEKKLQFRIKDFEAGLIQGFRLVAKSVKQFHEQLSDKGMEINSRRIFANELAFFLKADGEGPNNYWFLSVAPKVLLTQTAAQFIDKYQSKEKCFEKGVRLGFMQGAAVMSNYLLRLGPAFETIKDKLEADSPGLGDIICQSAKTHFEGLNSLLFLEMLGRFKVSDSQLEIFQRVAQAHLTQVNNSVESKT